jgi:hypothetical protein
MDDMIVLIQSGVGIACVLVLWIKLGSYLHRKGFDWASTIGLVLSITLLLIAVFYYWIFSLFPLAQFGFILAGIPLVLLFLTVILWNMISLAVFSKLREPPKIRATIIMLFILGIVYLLPLRQGPLWVEFLVGYRARVAIVKEIKAGNFSYLKSHYNGKFYELPVFNKYYCWKCGLIELVGLRVAPKIGPIENIDSVG